MLWLVAFVSQYVPDTGSAYGYAIAKTTDGYVLSGIFISPFLTGEIFFAMRMDSMGNILWFKQYIGNGDGYDGWKGVSPTADGGFVFSGYEGSKKNITKLDAQGNVVWSYTYNVVDEGADGLPFIMQTSDGSLLVVGYKYLSFNADVWVMKLNADGTVQFSKLYGTSGIDWGLSGVEVSDGFVIAGWTTVNGNQDILLMKIDPSGNLLWAKTYGDTSAQRANSIVATSDGGFVLYGFQGSPGDNLLMKLDSLGDVEWVKTYDLNNSDESCAGRCSYSIVETNDGYIFSGITFLAKVDTLGNVVWAKGIQGAFGYNSVSEPFGNSEFVALSRNMYVFNEWCSDTTFTLNVGSPTYTSVSISATTSTLNTTLLNTTLYDAGINMNRNELCATSTREGSTCFAKIVGNTIYFGRETNWKLYDLEGRLVRKGYSRTLRIDRGVFIVVHEQGRFKVVGR